ncbi:YjjG family noncanonical pyrimidine nucleotidase [Massilia sp. METH4]|uniref:YjjG family noncanonical pyrimidine nucleotidase n=1 Tax=Massilia sp. METH4 TaxID=3123041 RepID=UPI0030D1A39E
MKHRLFLFDLDDTLLDFKASEHLSFQRALGALGFTDKLDGLFAHYQVFNTALWRQFEAGTVSKEFLKVERFRQSFQASGLDLDPEAASRLFVESLSDTVVLIDGAAALCEELAATGELGIVTNGAEQIQQLRIASSGLGKHISFVCTSEACGFAKPDVRFFEHAGKLARAFARHEAIIVGDRLDADILGANRYGIESCWFNPGKLANDSQAVPTFEVAALHEVVPALRASAEA